MFKLTLGIGEEYGRLCMTGRHASVLTYQLCTLFGYGDIMITRKDQFLSAESAFVTILNKFIEQDLKDNPRYQPPGNEEEFIWDAEPWLMPVYGMQEIKEIPVEKFLRQYEFIHDSVTGFETWYEEGKRRIVYQYESIRKDGDEYTGNYRRFDPLLGLEFEKCYAVFDEDWKRCEYLGVTGRFYIYLTWRYTAPQQT